MTLKIKEQFEGRVDEIPKKHFWQRRTFMAFLIDLEGTHYVVEVYYKAVPFKDRKLIQLGATFKWTIYENDTIGKSVIEFNHLGVWTKEEVEMIEIKAKEMYEDLNWINNN